MKNHQRSMPSERKKKTKRTDDLINAVAADIENDRRVSIKTLAAAHDVSVDTIHRILHQDLGLEKKISKMGAKTALRGPKTGESESLF
jgi:hypothetical protein